MAAVLCVLAGPGRAGEPAVRLRVPPPVRPGVAAMPLIADPADAAARRVNAALRRLDDAVRGAIRDCRGEDGRPGDWDRSIDVPMRGPDYLSFVITDDAFCGGAHPNGTTTAIVYDLHSGQPVDWTRLLPPALTGTVALATGLDGTRMVTLASKRLYALYLAGYDLGAVDPGDRAACDEAIRVSGDDPPAMIAWPDARAGGLMVQFDLPHAVQNCEAPVLIPLDTLRTEGAAPALLRGIAAARR